MGGVVDFTETTARQAEIIREQREKMERLREDAGAQIVCSFVLNFEILLSLIKVAQNNNLQQSNSTVQEIVFYLLSLKEERKKINKPGILKPEYETEICKVAKTIFSPLLEKYPDIREDIPNFWDFCLAYSVIEPKG